uniref:Bromo domain-containing protein n=1 Tax=Caenorhabditis tropicalis TaxID=1561998 RepID=A0A1I7TS49_9PELO
MPYAKNPNQKPPVRRIDEVSQGEIDKIEKYILKNKVTTYQREEIKKLAEKYKIVQTDISAFVALIVRGLKSKDRNIEYLNRKWFRKDEETKERMEKKLKENISEYLTEEDVETIESLCREKRLSTSNTREMKRLSDEMDAPYELIKKAIVSIRKKMKEEGACLWKRKGLFTDEQGEELKKDLKKFEEEKKHLNLKQTMKYRKKIADKYGKTWRQIAHWKNFEKWKQNPEWRKKKNEKNAIGYLEGVERCNGLEGRKRAEENEKLVASEPQFQINVVKGPKQKSSLKRKRSSARISIAFAEETEVRDYVKNDDDEEEQSSSNGWERNRSPAKRMKRDSVYEYDEEDEMDLSGQGPSSSSWYQSPSNYDEEDMSDEEDEESNSSRGEGNRRVHDDQDSDEEESSERYEKDSDDESDNDQEDTASSFESSNNPREENDDEGETNEQEEERGDLEPIERVASPPSFNVSEEVAPTEEPIEVENEEVRDTRPPTLASSKESSSKKKTYILKELVELNLRNRKLLPEGMSKNYETWTILTDGLQYQLRNGFATFRLKDDDTFISGVPRNQRGVVQIKLGCGLNRLPVENKLTQMRSVELIHNCVQAETRLVGLYLNSTWTPLTLVKDADEVTIAVETRYESCYEDGIERCDGSLWWLQVGGNEIALLRDKETCESGEIEVDYGRRMCKRPYNPERSVAISDEEGNFYDGQVMKGFKAKRFSLTSSSSMISRRRRKRTATSANVCDYTIESTSTSTTTPSTTTQTTTVTTTLTSSTTVTTTPTSTVTTSESTTTESTSTATTTPTSTTVTTTPTSTTVTTTPTSTTVTTSPTSTTLSTTTLTTSTPITSTTTVTTPTSTTTEKTTPSSTSTQSSSTTTQSTSTARTSTVTTTTPKPTTTTVTTTVTPLPANAICSYLDETTTSTTVTTTLTSTTTEPSTSTVTTTQTTSTPTTSTVTTTVPTTTLTTSTGSTSTPTTTVTTPTTTVTTSTASTSTPTSTTLTTSSASTSTATSTPTTTVTTSTASTSTPTTTGSTSTASTSTPTSTVSSTTSKDTSSSSTSSTASTSTASTTSATSTVGSTTEDPLKVNFYFNVNQTTVYYGTDEIVNLTISDNIGNIGFTTSYRCKIDDGEYQDTSVDGACFTQGKNMPLKGSTYSSIFFVKPGTYTFEGTLTKTDETEYKTYAVVYIVETTSSPTSSTTSSVTTTEESTSSVTSTSTASSTGSSTSTDTTTVSSTSPSTSVSSTTDSTTSESTTSSSSSSDSTSSSTTDSGETSTTSSDSNSDSSTSTSDPNSGLTSSTDGGSTSSQDPNTVFDFILDNGLTWNETVYFTDSVSITPIPTIVLDSLKVRSLFWLCMI